MQKPRGFPSAQELRELKRSEIIRVASRCFSHRGYHRTSLRDVAHELGLTKAALYYYFEDKQALLFACSREAHEGVLLLSEGDDASPLIRLRHLCRSYVEYVVGNELGFIMYSDIENLSASERRVIVRLRDKFENRMRDLIGAACRHGELRTDNIKLAVLTLLGALNWIPKWLRPSGKLTSAQVADTITQTILLGMGAKPRAFK